MPVLSTLVDRTDKFLQGELDPVPEKERTPLAIDLMSEWSTIRDQSTKSRSNRKSNRRSKSRSNRKSRDPSPSDRMHAVLSHWCEIVPHPQTTQPFEMMIEVFRQEQDGDQAAEVLDLWGHLLGGHLELAPTLEAFHKVLEAYGGTNLQGSYTLLDFLDQSFSTGTYHLKPNTETLAHVMDGIVKSKTSQYHGKSIEWLVRRLQKQTPESTHERVELLRGYARAIQWASKHNKTELENYWMDVMHNLITPDFLHSVDLYALNYIGDAYRAVLCRLHEEKTQTKENMQRAVGLVRDLENMASDRKLEEAVAEYEKMVESMTSSSENGVGGSVGLDKSKGIYTLPNTGHYTYAIDVTANPSLLPESADYSKDLLQSMESRHGHSKKIPLRAYDGVIRVLCEANRIEEAEELLWHVLRLLDDKRVVQLRSDSVAWTCNAVMEGYFRRDQVERCVDVYNKMNERNIPHDASTYGCALRALSRSRDRKAHRINAVWKKLINDKTVEPDRMHYSAMTTAYSRMSGRQAAEQATELLEELERKYAETRDFRMKACVATYSSVITAWGRQRGPRAAAEAMRVFRRMKQLHTPDVPAYGAIISALANGGSPEAAEQAEELLNECDATAKEMQDESMRPSQWCYSAAMQAWALSGSEEAGRRSQAILQQLEDLYRSTGDTFYRPDHVTYGTLIRAWGTSKAPDAPERVDAILDVLRQAPKAENLLTNLTLTNAMLCHCKSGRPDAGARSEALLREMEELAKAGAAKMKPDTIAYTNVIQAWAVSNVPDRVQHAQRLLDEMCDAYEAGDATLKPNTFSFGAFMLACVRVRGDKQVQDEALKAALMAMTRLQKYERATYHIYLVLLEVIGMQCSDADKREQYASTIFEMCCQDGQAHHTVVGNLKKFVPRLYRNLPRDAEGQLDLPPEWTLNLVSANASSTNKR